MSGYSAATFSPWAGAKRAQVAVAMSRYLDLPAVEPGSEPVGRSSRCNRPLSLVSRRSREGDGNAQAAGLGRPELD